MRSFATLMDKNIVIGPSSSRKKYRPFPSRILDSSMTQLSSYASIEAKFFVVRVRVSSYSVNRPTPSLPRRGKSGYIPSRPKRPTLLKRHTLGFENQSLHGRATDDETFFVPVGRGMDLPCSSGTEVGFT